MKTKTFLMISLISTLSWTDPRAGAVEAALGSMSPADTYLTSKRPVMDTPEIACLLAHLDPHPENPKILAEAKTNAEALAKSLSDVDFKPSTFNRNSLFQFLAQIQAESSGGNIRIQPDQPPEKTGYGAIMITGSKARIPIAKCMEESCHGSSAGVCSNPASTLGTDPFQSMLASVCYWKLNISDNRDNDGWSVSDTPLAVRAVTQIVNVGHVEKEVTDGNSEDTIRRNQMHTKVTNGDSNIRARQENFAKLLELDAHSGACGRK